MNLSDEELQVKIEQGAIPESADAKAYRRIFDALQEEPGYLAPGFADRLMARLKGKEDSSDLVWLWLGVGALLITAAIAVGMTSFRFGVGTFTFVSGYSGLFIFGLLFVLLLHYVDRQWIRPGAES